MEQSSKISKRLWQIAKAVQKQRRKLHKGQKTTRILNPDGDAIGIYGEMCFGGKIGIPADLSKRIAGDQGDFITPIGTIDVKTSSRDYGLPVPKKLCKPQLLYVQAVMSTETLWIDFQCWQYGHILMKGGVKRLKQDGPLNYWVSSFDARPVQVLYQLLGMAGKLGLYRPKDRLEVIDHYLQWSKDHD